MLKKNKANIAFKLESTAGTENAPGAADIFIVFDPMFTPTIEMNDRNPVAVHLSPFPGVPGVRSGKMTFEVELRGRAALSSLIGSDVDYGDALLACGMAMTSNASSVIYKPSSTSSTASIALFMDGKCFRLWGAAGNVKFIMADGKPVRAQFEFTGSDFAVVDSALISAAVETTLPPVFMGATATISHASSSLAMCIESMEVDSGNTVALRKCASATSGHASAIITERATSITMNPEAVVVATLDFFGYWRSGTEANLSTSFGSVAGNRIAFAAPKVQYQSISLSDREGLLVYDINAKANASVVATGNDEFSLTFY
jgi:hypothetical protein